MSALHGIEIMIIHIRPWLVKITLVLGAPAVLYYIFDTGINFDTNGRNRKAPIE